MKREHGQLTPANAQGSDRQSTLLEQSLIFTVVMLFMSAMFAKLDDACRCSNDRKPRACSIPTWKPSSAEDHWQAHLRDLKAEFARLGLTAKQESVAMGIIQQKTYEEISDEMRITKRAVCDHAMHVFKKVGCAKRSEFHAALMRSMSRGRTSDRA
ncbi:MAG: hypothetical protein HFJ65_05140 [Eggerthellaceae bacterium]|nr:hypothetical protein [Eggerthellaceae bacterium]